ncbi:MAG TPA: acyltransferase [Salinimicrobium sp.]|nr:acyltransferase [Salinimicrobium sp.]
MNRIHPRIKPTLWRRIGCKIGKNVSIGYDVYLDVHNARLLTVEDGVWIASRSVLFCHKRDLTAYYKGEDYNKLTYKKLPIYLKKGCVVGIGCMIMPGVTIGEGSIIGAGSLVINDIPAWSIAVGHPAKVVKEIPERPQEV